MGGDAIDSGAVLRRLVRRVCRVRASVSLDWWLYERRGETWAACGAGDWIGIAGVRDARV